MQTRGGSFAASSPGRKGISLEMLPSVESPERASPSQPSKPDRLLGGDSAATSMPWNYRAFEGTIPKYATLNPSCMPALGHE